jgi:hypothetical protein
VPAQVSIRRPEPCLVPPVAIVVLTGRLGWLRCLGSLHQRRFTGFQVTVTMTACDYDLGLPR